MVVIFKLASLFWSQEGDEECCKNPVMRDHELGEHAESSIAIHQPTESTQHFLTSEIGSHVSKVPDSFSLDFSELSCQK